MRCRTCQSDNSPDRGFCGECGAALPVLCPTCGFQNAKEVHFCGGCGGRIRPTALGSVTASQPVVDYTPEHLVHRILRSRASVEGERKLVTVMFVDIRGSFEMISHADAEQAQALLDSMLRSMIECVHQYGGTVNQVLGDGFMALFGAPLSYEDHAVRAAYAALAIQQRGKDERGRSLPDSGLAGRVRIGLNSGEVVIRTIRNDLSMDYRAVGPTTHMAARMEQMAPPGAIRVTGHTVRLAEGLLDVESLGSLEIKGITEAIDIYELKGIHTHPTRIAGRIAKGASPFVGREAEMSELRVTLERVLRGGFERVTLQGEPGVGKSRLWYELVHSELAESCLVLEAAPTSYTRSAPYSALAGCLRHLFEIRDADTTHEIAEKVTDWLQGLDPSLTVLSPIFLAVLDVPTADIGWNRLDPAQKRQRIFEAAQHLLASLCDRQPVILLWEDLHWFDSESLALLRTIIEDPPSHRMLVGLTHRPEFRPVWLDHGSHVSRRLGALPAETTQELVDELIGKDPALDDIRAVLVERTAGNPFFVEESVRSLVDSGVLTGEPGAYRPTASPQDFEVPRTVEAVISSRIDRLDTGVKEFVQAAAVIGDEVPVELLRRTTELPEAVFYERLESATQAGILFELQLFPTPIYRFAHSLTHKVVYRSMLREHRAALQAYVVAAIENLYSDRIDEHLDRLAQHSREAGLWEKAVHYHERASVRAATRWANREAVTLIDEGLQILPKLTDGDVRAEAAIRLRLAALAPLLPLGEKQRMVQLLHEAEEIARSIGDQRRLGAIYSQLTTALWMCGDSEGALVTGERSLEIAKERHDEALRAAARFNLGVAHNTLGNFKQGTDLLRTLVADLSGDLERRRMGWAAYPSVLCRTFLSRSLVHVGEFAEALEHIERGCTLADELQHPYSRAIVREPLGFYHLTLGHLDAALETFEQSLEIARANEVWTMYPAMLGRSAMTLAGLGRHEEALRMAEDGLKRKLYRLGSAWTQHWLLAAAAAARAGLGRYDDALATASELEKLTAAHGDRAHHVDALKLEGDVHASRGERFAGRAERAYRAAMELAEDCGMRPMLARCLESLADLHAAGSPQEAARCLRRARDLYVALGMRGAADRIGSGPAAAR